MEHDLAKAMAGLVRGVTRVRVIDGGVSKGQALAGPLLCELVGDDAAGLLERLAVVAPDGQFHCMCLGHPALELWAGDTLRATVGVHHGLSVRVHGWWSDAPLRDGEGLLRWLADRGVGGPLATWMNERAAAGHAERQRMAWMAATPAVLRSRLAGLEGQRMLPRRLLPTDADAASAVAAMREALGEGAAVALLGWYGGPGGPWNGYPSYEEVACVLLRCMSVEEVIAAGRDGDEGVLLGLGRFLARHGAAPRERKLVDDGLRERLVELVARRGDEDMQARLAGVMRRVEPRTRGGARVGDAELAWLGGPVVCAGGTAAIDGASVARFEPGRTDGTMVVSLPDGVIAGLAAVEEDLLITLSQTGEVWRVPARGGAVRVVARGQARPMSPIGFAGRAAWLEQAELSGHRTATRVRLEGAAEVLYEHTDNAWDLIACDGALWWARHGGSLWSTLFGKNIHRVDLMRRDVRGRVEVIKVLEGGEDGVSFPRLFTDGERIAWTSGQKIGVMNAAKEVRWFAVDAEILAVHPVGEAVLVAVAREQVGELLRIDAGGQRVLAQWRRALWERERLAVHAGRVTWNSGEHLWAVDLP